MTILSSAASSAPRFLLVINCGRRANALPLRQARHDRRPARHADAQRAIDATPPRAGADHRRGAGVRRAAAGHRIARARARMPPRDRAARSRSSPRRRATTRSATTRPSVCSAQMDARQRAMVEQLARVGAETGRHQRHDALIRHRRRQLGEDPRAHGVADPVVALRRRDDRPVVRAPRDEPVHARIDCKKHEARRASVSSDWSATQTVGCVVARIDAAASVRHGTFRCLDIGTSTARRGPTAASRARDERGASGSTTCGFAHCDFESRTNRIRDVRHLAERGEQRLRARESQPGRRAGGISDERAVLNHRQESVAAAALREGGRDEPIGAPREELRGAAHRSGGAPPPAPAPQHARLGESEHRARERAAPFAHRAVGAVAAAIREQATRCLPVEIVRQLVRQRSCRRFDRQLERARSRIVHRQRRIVQRFTGEAHAQPVDRQFRKNACRDRAERLAALSCSTDATTRARSA